jgi:signal transduction histidine kinase
MDQTGSRTGAMPEKLSVGEPENALRGIATFRSVAGWRAVDKTQLEQGAHVRTQSALLNTKVAIFAHEVANPLAGISNSLDVIENRLERNHVADLVVNATIQDVRLELDRLGALLNEFRCLSLPPNLDPKSSDLTQIIKEVLALQTTVYTTAGITVKYDFENTCPALTLDAAKIKQVILNLCNNAIEAMPNGGCLTVKCYSSGETVVLEISDNGNGIPEGVNIFELFKTTKINGSGLGLSVVEQIVSAHKATISYMSEPNRGATFKIAFPAVV